MFSENELENIKENVYGIITNKKLMLISAGLMLVFLAISIYMYLTYIKPVIFKNFEMNSEFIPRESDDKIVVMYFYTEWCPYCKAASKEWNSFKTDVNKRTFDIPIVFREIDCDMYQDIAEEYNIESYPTIKILYREDVYLYDAKPDRLHLMEFLVGSLPDKKTETEFEKDMQSVEVLV